MRSCGVRRPSVCLSVCPSVNILRKSLLLYQTNGWITTKLAHDGPQKGQHPGYAQGQGRGQRSRDTGTLMSKSRNELLRH